MSENTMSGHLDLGFFLAYMVIVLAIGFAAGPKERATVAGYRGLLCGYTLPVLAGTRNA